MDNKALLILKSNYPEEHVDIGSGYNNLAREYYSLKKYGIALEYYLKAHQIYEHVYGERHSFTAEVSGNISKTFMELNDYESALTWCLAALHTQKETLGEEHPEVILRHSFVSEIYEHLGLLDKAIIHLQIIRGYYKRLERNDILQIVDDRIRHNRQSLEAIYNEHL
jgi:tetratricopeptide (TPR) repeat protein